MKKKISLFLGILTFIGGSVAVWSHSVGAGASDLIINQGFVAASNEATYEPATRGPVEFSPNGACPRWTGTINDTNLSASPISSNITQSSLQAGDTVTFAVTLQNISSVDDVYDVMIQHDIPEGFELPGVGAQGANLCIQNGANQAIAYTAQGGGFFGSNTDDDYIELDDAGGPALTTANPTNGENIAIITFDLRVAEDFNPASTKETTAHLLGFSDADGGDLFPGESTSNTINLRDYEYTKTLQSTNLSSTAGDFVAIGEQVTYEVTVWVPQGLTRELTIVDGMADGIAMLRCESVTNNNPESISTDYAGGFGAMCNDPINPQVGTNGKDVVFDLGNVTNSNRDSSEEETVTFVYTAVIDNVPAAYSQMSLDNAAAAVWNDGRAASATASVTVQEPILEVTTSISPSENVKEGTRVTVSTEIKNAAMASASAYGVDVRLTKPEGIEPVDGSIQCVNGANVVAQCQQMNNEAMVLFEEIATGASATVQYEAVVLPSLVGKNLAARTTANWSSLPGNVTSPQSSYSPTTIARSSQNTGGGPNPYSATSLAQVAVLDPSAGNGDGSGTGSDQAGDSANGLLPETGMNIWIMAVIGMMLLVAGGLVLKKVRR